MIEPGIHHSYCDIPLFWLSMYKELPELAEWYGFPKWCAGQDINVIRLQMKRSNVGRVTKSVKLFHSLIRIKEDELKSKNMNNRRSKWS